MAKGWAGSGESQRAEEGARVQLRDCEEEAGGWAGAEEKGSGKADGARSPAGGLKILVMP